MRARVSIYAFDPSRPELDELRAEKRAIWTDAVNTEPGHLGEISLDTDDGRQIVIHFWESAEAALAASVAHNPRLRKLIKEQFEPDYDTLWTRPPDHAMATVTRNDFSADDTLDKLYAIVDGLNRRSPDGDDPFRIIGRLCEKAGELEATINHFEETSIKTEKHGTPNRAQLANEIQDVLRAALSIARHYGIEDELRHSIDTSHDELRAEDVLA